jgi:hypothetical protein
VRGRLGWVFEADFFFQCKRANETKSALALQREPGFQLNPRNFFNFNHDDMLGKAHPLSASCTEPLSIYAQNELKQNIKSDLLEMVDRRCKPTKWNQGGYDGFDVTRWASHPLNLKYFVEVVNLFIDAGLAVCGCQFTFLFRKGKRPQFQR